MNVIVCLDDRAGFQFAGRRQSRDAALCEKIMDLTADSILWMNHYSYPLFSDLGGLVRVDDGFLEKAGSGDYCFVENVDVMPFSHKIEKIIIFYWNRRYPSDRKFPVAQILKDSQPIEVIDFPGRSHERITMEVYPG